MIPVNAEAERAAFKVCADLRAAGLTAEIGFSGNLSKRLKKAAGANSHAAVMVSPDELGWGVVTVKWLDTGAQEQNPLLLTSWPTSVWTGHPHDQELTNRVRHLSKRTLDAPRATSGLNHAFRTCRPSPRPRPSS